MKRKFSTHWKSSTQVRKQRKYRYNAPLHTKQKFVHVHLAPVLRNKYHVRNVQIRKGDKVRVLRGQFRKKEGRVERINLKREKVYVSGLEIVKKDGSKIIPGLAPHKIMILELELNDKKRKQKLEKNKLTKNRPAGKIAGQNSGKTTP